MTSMGFLYLFHPSQIKIGTLSPEFNAQGEGTPRERTQQMGIDSKPSKLWPFAELNHRKSSGSKIRPKWRNPNTKSPESRRTHRNQSSISNAEGRRENEVKQKRVGTLDSLALTSLLPAIVKPSSAVGQEKEADPE